MSEPTETEMKFLTYYDFHIYILEEPQHCNLFIESGYIDRYTPPKNTKERYLDSTNFSYFFPQPVIVLSEGRHLKAGGDRETALIGMCMIHLGQTFIRRLKRGGGLPSWAEAGMAHYFEGEFNSYMTVSVVEYPHYEPFVDKWIDGWETFPRWMEKLSNPAVLNSLPSIAQMERAPGGGAQGRCPGEVLEHRGLPREDPAQTVSSTSPARRRSSSGASGSRSTTPSSRCSRT